ncbi:MAG: DUF6036 family nucleotidyltransferase [Bacteroidota bacterium]|jgi:hypothetical protein
MTHPLKFSADVSEFMRLLSMFDVQYLVVGGEAVIYYGHARLTGDIDFFYDISDKNVEKLFEVLKIFWDGEIPEIKHKKELKKKGMVIQFGAPPNRLDLVNSIDGITFTAAWKNKVVESFTYKKKHYPVYYIGIDDLIKNKKAVHRNKDNDDIRFLTAVKKTVN